MSLFTPVIIPPPAPAPELVAANKVIQQGNQLYTTLVSQYMQSYNLVWDNSQATPDKIVAAMGTNANAIFIASAGLAAYLVSLGASVPLTMPKKADGTAWNYVANSDGSVTLS